MPVLNIHLVRGQHPEEKVSELLLRCSRLFAEGLRCPVDRVRVFATEHAPTQVCLGGQLATVAEPAPFFNFIVLEGRSIEDRQRLLSGFTDLMVEVLGVERSRVRGGVTRVEPEDWSIGGMPASVLRQNEIEARRLAALEK